MTDGGFLTVIFGHHKFMKKGDMCNMINTRGCLGGGRVYTEALESRVTVVCV